MVETPESKSEEPEKETRAQQEMSAALKKMSEAVEAQKPEVQQPPAPEKGAPAGDNVSRREFMKKGLKGLAFLGALAMAPEVFGQSQDKGKAAEAEKTSAAELPEKEQEKIIDSVLGKELADKYRKVGFHILVPLKSGSSNKYLIHVGQTHKNPSKELVDRIATEDTVSHFQGKLLPLLEDTAKVGGGVLFLEGVASESDMESGKEGTMELNKSLLDVNNGPISFDKAKKIDDILNSYFKYRNSDLVSNYIDVGLVEKVRGKFLKFLNTYQPKDEMEKDWISFFKTNLDSQGIGAAVESFGGDDANFNDAATKLYMESRVKVAPAETVEANKKTMDTIHGLTSARGIASELEFKMTQDDLGPVIREIVSLEGKKSKKIISEAELKRIEELKGSLGGLISKAKEKFRKSPESKKVEELEEEFKKNAAEQREKIAIGLLKKYEDKNGPLDNYVMVFGSAHNFIDQLRKHNESDGDNQGIGLITIKLSGGK
jgi:hypothetical protein